MKRLTLLVVITGLLVSLAAVWAQEKKIDEKKQVQMMEMMQDSTMMNMMMEHIAKNDNMRMQMMQKMMAACKSDESKQMGMCKMMMGDKDMHSAMMKMMKEGKMPHGMMDKSSESMEKQKKSDHEKHHPDN